MSDRTDPPTSSNPGGPWPRVTDHSMIYDHGRPSRVQAAAHSDHHGGYPGPHGQPTVECRGPEYHLDGAGEEQAGASVGISVYLTTRFGFGKPRDNHSNPSSRIVMEQRSVDGGEPATQSTASVGEALQPARVLDHVADELLFVERPAA